MRLPRVVLSAPISLIERERLTVKAVGEVARSSTAVSDFRFSTASARLPSLDGASEARPLLSRLQADDPMMGLEPVETKALSEQQIKVLDRLGVLAADHADFLAGEVTAFQYPTEGGPDVYGFLQLQNAALTSQLFSIVNTVGGAGAAFRNFMSSSNELAASFGLQSYEMQGGSVLNRDLATALVSRGFQPKVIAVPESLGGGVQEVLSKQIPVRRPGANQ